MQEAIETTWREETESVQAPWHPASGSELAKKSQSDRQGAVKTEGSAHKTRLASMPPSPLLTQPSWPGGIGKAQKIQITKT